MFITIYFLLNIATVIISTVDNQKKHYWLYVLKLEGSKYYIGITTQTPEIRLYEHKNGIRAAYWTKKYTPKKIIDRKDLGVMPRKEAEAYENKVVRAYMKQKGYNNVRGGDLTDIDDYVKRFGYYLLKDGWEVVTLVILFLLIIGLLVIKLYLKNVI